MPITFTIDADAATVRTVGSGYVTLAEVQDHFRELLAAWPAVPRLDVLLDLTACTSIPEFEQLRKVASHMDQFVGRDRFGRCAIVAGRELLYGMLRVFEVYAESQFTSIRVFRSEPEATGWLRAAPARQSAGR